MTTIIGVRFRSNGKMYYFDPQGIDVVMGDGVIVETARGLEYGECVKGSTEVPDQQVVQPLKRMIRVATEADRKVVERNRKRADEAYIICKQKIEDRGLGMNLVTVECTFDMNKMLFYFTADGRVDFRELVKDLAGVFRTRIELRQIGVRDEAKMVGGLGCCGRELCCSSYLDDFHPVSINMAKDQNLSLNPAKISGVCGRLMCCLKYEHEAYAELQKVTPRQGSVVDTPMGRGKVITTQMLRGICRVQLDDSPDHVLTEFRCEECTALKGLCRNRQNAAAMAEERRHREEAEKGESKPEKAEKQEKSDRQERPARAERPNRGDRPARPPRAERPAPQPKPAPQESAEPLPQGAENAEGEIPGEENAAPRRRRRRGGRRRRKPVGDGAPQAESAGASEE